MSFDYFYGQQSDLFTFYRVPKVLFTNERFWNISADAKMLYGILLDRMSLSAKNGWIDKNGRVYIIFTIDEAKMALNCAEQKAIKLLSELEKKAGLIERKRQGLGKPNLIYVKNFISAVDSQLLNCENHNSGTMEITTQELPKSQCNNTDIKNTEFSDTDSIFPSGNGGMMDENDRYQEYFDYFSDQLSMDLLKKDYPYDSEMLDTALVLKTPKTKTSVRKVFLPKTVAEMLVQRKADIEELKDLFGDEFVDFNLVFCSSNGKPIEGQVINRAFNKLIEEKGLPKVVFHSLRHSSITYKLKLNGGDMKSVQGDSGHAQVKMVADVYSHIIDDDRRLNAERMEAAFYSGRQATPEPVQPAATESSADDKELLLKLLQNPEMAALLKSLAKTL